MASVKTVGNVQVSISVHVQQDILVKPAKLTVRLTTVHSSVGCQTTDIFPGNYGLTFYFCFLNVSLKPYVLGDSLGMPSPDV